jgi:DUF1016 N-terminal domain
MKLFAEAFPDGPIAKQSVSQLPWGQIIRLIQMVKDPATRDFSIRETLTHGWSRAILEMQIRNQLHHSHFNPIEFDGIRKQAGLNRFILTVKQLAVIVPVVMGGEEYIKIEFSYLTT